jgi:sigma-B regulation protein RsbQ
MPAGSTIDDADPLARNNVSVTGPQSPRGTLVLVHGLGTNQQCWDQVAAAFADWRIVRLDNVGASPVTQPHFRHNRYLKLDAYADDLVGVLDALQLQDAVLVGHSVGAMISMLAAQGRPQRVARLVMIGASPRYQDEPGYHGGFRPEDVDDIYRAITADHAGWAAGFAAAAVGTDNPHYGAEFAASLRDIPAAITLTVLYSILQSDLRETLRHTTQPTLLIQSREDHVVPLEVAQYLNSQIRGSQLEIIDASGHLPHVTAAPLVVGAMQRFLANPANADGK